jgi:Transglycosylase SLT domain
MDFVNVNSVDQERTSMKKLLTAGTITFAILLTWTANPTQAACREIGTCSNPLMGKVASTKNAPRKSAIVGKKRAHAIRGSGMKIKTSGLKSKRTGLRIKKRTSVAKAPTASQGRVVSLISSMAPAHGVPTWFALKIAKVESGYNSHLRGRAGEYGVYQLKCATARGIGFLGNCSALLDPAVNVRYGLRHLALAMKSSGGNLKLAASKHNGGLGRKTMVAGYVAKVF